MKRSRLISAFLTFVFLLGAFTSAHSSTVRLDYVFDDVTLSGSFSYDDTTSALLSGNLAGFTAYTPTSISVAYSSGGTTFSWNLADYVPFALKGFTLLPTMDPYGTWQTSEISITPVGWANSTFVNMQGATLVFLTCLNNTITPYSWCGNSIYIDDVGSNRLIESTYGTSSSVIPIPAAVWLFGSGLIGFIGMARRKAHV